MLNPQATPPKFRFQFGMNLNGRRRCANAKSKKPGGTGLGTKIVKDVVDAHKGRVTVESEVGVGTTFHVYLPLSPLSVHKAQFP